MLYFAALPAFAALLAGERTYEGYSFDAYASEFGKVYASPSERAEAEAKFSTNMKSILLHNAQETKSWYAAVNKYSDISPAEFKALKATKRPRDLTMEAAPVFDTPVESLPASKDWRDTDGVVTPVKNKGGCGSCWAFSATEALESAAAISSGKAAPVLSPQQICAPNPDQCGGTGGCDGSTQELAFKYTEGPGLSLESAYPYRGETGKCDTSKIQAAVTNTGYVRLPDNNYTALMNAVGTIGPMAISLAASSFGWQFYGGGVYDGKNCGWDQDHAVGLVGYGTEGAKDYWIVRNSWAASWGEKGYMRLERFGEGKEPCGMDNTPGDGSACKGDTKPVQLCGACGVLSDSSYPTGVKLA